MSLLGSAHPSSEEDGMLGSVWLPIIFCLVMMAVCCGGPLLVGRWRRARQRPQQAPSAMLWIAAGGGGKERVDG
jgi:hypothetical protein